MRPILIASVVFCCLGARSTAQTNSWLGQQDYGIGQLVGECVPAKCQVFVAQLDSDSPKSGETVALKVVEGLWAIGSEGTLQLPYAALTGGKGEPDLALSWRNVSFSRGALATVVLAREKIGAIKSGEPLFVTTSDHASATLRYLATEASRSTAPSYSVSDAMDSCSRENNPALAGFLFSYLAQHTAINHPEIASPLLVKLLGSPSVPDSERESVEARIVVDYYRLPEADRMGTVGKLADVAQTQNVHAAAAALRGLGRIAGFDNSTWTYVTPATLGGVALAYRNLREKDLIPKTETLEIGLGGRQGPAR